MFRGTMSSIKPRKRPYRQLIAEEPSGTILLTQSGNTEHTQGSDDAMSIAMSASCAYDVLPHSSPKWYFFVIRCELFVKFGFLRGFYIFHIPKVGICRAVSCLLLFA